MTFEALLAAFDREHDFAILSLGGRGCISGAWERELEHIIAINPGVVAIIDSEKCSASDPLEACRSEFANVCDRLGIKWQVLERRAIENYLLQRAIRAAFPEAPFVELGPCDDMKHRRPCWEKRDDWRIARAMRKSEIENTDLGQFLGSLWVGLRSGPGKLLMPTRRAL